MLLAVRGWFLAVDPLAVEIVAGDVDSNSTGANPFQPTGADAQIGVDNINAAINADAANITISTNVAGGDAGDITVLAPILKSEGTSASLTLEAAGGAIFINESITSTSNAESHSECRWPNR